MYLDVWEEERPADGADGDDRLVDPVIGLETAVRIERRWTIGVAEDAADFESLLLDEAGHKYTPLARLHRTASPRIQDHMIQNLRRLGLTLADGHKSPMFDQRGTEVLDATRFAAMLAALRSAYRHWQENEQFPVVVATLAILYAYQNAINEVYNLAVAAEVAADAGNLDNANGIAALEKNRRSRARDHGRH